MFRFNGQVRAPETHPGCDYTDAEWEFIRAMEKYQRRFRRRFPTWREALRVARSLGYRKVARPTDVERLPDDDAPEPTAQDLERIEKEEAARSQPPAA